MKSIGYNVYGELGVGSTKNEPYVKEVLFPERTKIVQIAIAGCHSLALSDTGDVYAWVCFSFVLTLM